jgi:signal transduction histidine kinase
MAAFVPLPGPDEPLGIMVGVAGAGRRLAPASVSLMEAVASTLGESLQRGEAVKARRESDIKSEALSTVSHEMRSPISSMLDFTQLLLDGRAGVLSEQQRDYVTRVAGAAQNLLGLVNDYFDLARVMAGSLAINRELVHVSEEIDEVVQLHEPLATGRGVVVRTNAPPGLVANVDRLRLRQVLTDLLDNAIKFTQPRGHVRVEAAGGANGVRISVIDTGVGIPFDRQHLVFKEFARVSDDELSGSPGIGLALTKRFVEAMGGFIRFTSSPGSGTVFDVWLPGERSPMSTTG